MSSSLTQTIQAGNGTKTQFAFNFPYISRSEIHVYFWNTTTKQWDEKLTTDSTYPWEISDANPNVVNFTSTAPPSPTAPVDPNETTEDNVKISRITNTADIRAFFNPGSAIRSSDFNNNFEQLRYAIQESNTQSINVEDQLKDYYWNNFNSTVYSTETWDSDDDQVATTQAIDAQIDAKINTAITEAPAGTIDFNLVSDTTPQLGGNLDVNGNTITSTSGANVVLDPNGDGTVDVSTSRITSVTDPTDASDAATKNYVDSFEVGTSNLAAAAVTSGKLASDSVISAKIADDAVTAAKLADTSVTAGSYTTADITVDAQGRITSAASGTVVLAAGQVDTNELAADAVTSGKLASNSVITAKINDAAVTTAKIADDAVTTAKLADNLTLGGSTTISGATTFSSASLSTFTDGGLTFDDNIYLYFGSGAGSDFKLGTDGTNLILTLGSDVSDFYIKDGTDTKFQFHDNGDLDVTGNIISNDSIAQGSNGYAIYNGGIHQFARNAASASTIFQVFGQDGKFQLKGDGDAQNTNNNYGGTSDSKLKENIVDASSQWNDIKSIQVRNYNFKAETNFPTYTQIGVVAQELETVCPGLVKDDIDEDSNGNDLGTTTKSVKYSVLYMKAVKALQEAMIRIETLETKVAALESVS